MLSFTCNNCGVVLKEDVAEHVEKCRGPFPLTCTNCLQDFAGNEYIDHTSCETVVATTVKKLKRSRRQGHSYPKKVQQQNWTSAMLTALSSPCLTSHQSSLLTALTKRPSIPRKKKEFQKFALHVWELGSQLEGVVEQVFSLIELEMKKIARPSIKKTGVDTVVKETTSNESKERKHKKLKKVAVEMETNGKRTEEKTTDAVMEDTTNKKSKKNKHRRREGEAVEETRDRGNGAGEKTLGSWEDMTCNSIIKEEVVPRKKSRKASK